MTRESDSVRAGLLNVQACSCGHDRLSHGQYLGRGKDRVVILNCPHAGRCMVLGCKCSHFRFNSNIAGPESIKRRKEELSKFKIVPPEGE